jgi:hypothetical protein
MKNMKTKIVLLITLSFYVWFFGNLLYDQIILAPKANTVYETLQQEYQNLNTLPDSTLTSSSLNNKAQNVLLNYYYNTNKSWSQICDFYLKEAQNNGWKWDGVIEQFGENNNGRGIHLKKSDYILYVGCGDIQKESHNFVVIFSWDGKQAPFSYGNKNK